MKASETTPGKKYFSKTNIPVMVVKITPTGVVLDSKIFNNKISVPLDYELRPDETEIISNSSQSEEMTRKEETMNNATENAAPETTQKRGKIAPLIDALLLEGGHTASEIAALVSEQAADVVQGRRITPHVYARISALEKKGFRKVVNDQKQIQVVK